MAWRRYFEGADPERDVIVRRRFGPAHDRPCNRPEVITCARWQCQKANRCQSATPAQRGEARNDG